MLRASLDTTRRYLDATAEGLREVVRGHPGQVAPRDHLRRSRVLTFRAAEIDLRRHDEPNRASPVQQSPQERPDRPHLPPYSPAPGASTAIVCGALRPQCTSWEP
jgi:hypothetical protein